MCQAVFLLGQPATGNRKLRDQIARLSVEVAGLLLLFGPTEQPMFIFPVWELFTHFYLPTKWREQNYRITSLTGLFSYLKCNIFPAF